MDTSGRTFSFLEVKAKIEAWCAYQERCHFEVDEKLKAWKVDLEDRQQLISHLISFNFLNEERFAEAFVSGKYKIKKWGRNKILQHLRQKRIPDVICRKALMTIDEEVYLDNLKHLANRKWQEKTGKHFVKSQKVSLYLYQKGYETDLIAETLKGFV